MEHWWKNAWTPALFGLIDHPGKGGFLHLGRDVTNDALMLVFPAINAYIFRTA